jgi:hypothetical protein
MGEIAEMLQQKANLSPEQAQQVEQLITQHIMSRVPSEFQGVVGSVLGASGAEAAPAESGGLGSLLGEATSLFGGNKG